MDIAARLDDDSGHRKDAMRDHAIAWYRRLCEEDPVLVPIESGPFEGFEFDAQILIARAWRAEDLDPEPVWVGWHP